MAHGISFFTFVKTSSCFPTLREPLIFPLPPERKQSMCGDCIIVVSMGIPYSQFSKSWHSCYSMNQQSRSNEHAFQEGHGATDNLPVGEDVYEGRMAIYSPVDTGSHSLWESEINTAVDNARYNLQHPPDPPSGQPSGPSEAGLPVPTNHVESFLLDHHQRGLQHATRGI